MALNALLVEPIAPIDQLELGMGIVPSEKVNNADQLRPRIDRYMHVHNMCTRAALEQDGVSRICYPGFLPLTTRTGGKTWNDRRDLTTSVHPSALSAVSYSSVRWESAIATLPPASAHA